MAGEDAGRFVTRWREGRTPYSRIRRHAIRLQLEAVIALALQVCLRRREIFALDLNCMSADNAYVVVAGFNVPWTERARAVPFTEAARGAIADWLAFRRLLGAEHDRPWIALHGGPAVGQPMKPEAFDVLLRTYLGDGWSLKRLRDTGAVRWASAGIGVEHLRQILGQSAIEDTLPSTRSSHPTAWSRTCIASSCWPRSPACVGPSWCSGDGLLGLLGPCSKLGLRALVRVQRLLTRGRPC